MGVFNIGTGVRTSDKEVFDAVKSATASSHEPVYSDNRAGEVNHIALDATRARESLGWKPQVDFQEGVKRAVAFYASQKA